MSLEEIGNLAPIIVVAGGIGGVLLKYGLDKHQKKAKIDYTWYHEHKGVQYPPCDIPAKYEPRYVSVFVRNRGELDGKIELTLSANGATVTGSNPGVYSNRVVQPVFLANDNEWHVVTFWIKPDDNSNYFDFTIDGKGIGRTQAHCRNPPTYKYWKIGSMFHCQPPTV